MAEEEYEQSTVINGIRFYLSKNFDLRQFMQQMCKFPLKDLTLSLYLS